MKLNKKTALMRKAVVLFMEFEHLRAPTRSVRWVKSKRLDIYEPAYA